MEIYLFAQGKLTQWAVKRGLFLLNWRKGAMD
jgi:hypothetical protein